MESPVFHFFALFNLGTSELLIVLIILLLLFGAKKLPELAGGLAKSIREFKKAATEVEDSFKEAIDATEPPPPKEANKEKEETKADNA
ncbi:MAG: twin-arginine translocase TatA/TatE family subunit [Opitutales bacterium]|nr:twin-arginine translocase TatA/TatE family subunit [Opitutales bacterium]